MHPERDARLAVEILRQVPGAACIGCATMLAKPGLPTIERRAGHGEQPAMKVGIDRLEQCPFASLTPINPDGVLAETQAG
jgi:hypothetical protein